MSDEPVTDEPVRDTEATTGTEASSGGAPASGRRWLLPVLALAAIVVAVVVIALSGGDDDDGATDNELPELPDLPAAVDGELLPSGQAVVDLLALGERSTYHATYVVEGDPALTGGEVTIEVWRDGGRARAETRTVTDEGTAETASIVDGDEAVTCTRIDDADFVCEESDPPPGVGADLAGSIRDQLGGVEVAERADEIDGREVRCFDFATVDGPGQLCATPTGVVVLLGIGDTVLRLTDLDDDVPATVFAPPAEVTPPADE